MTCPEDTPHFNLETNKCQGCEEGDTYFAKERTCKKFFQLTNTDAAENYINAGDNTYENVVEKNKETIDNYPTAVCPEETPYSTGTECIACSKEETPYFNFDTLECQGCAEHDIYDPNLHICRGTNPYTNTIAISKYIEEEDATLENIKTQNE